MRKSRRGIHATRFIQAPTEVLREPSPGVRAQCPPLGTPYTFFAASRQVKKTEPPMPIQVTRGPTPLKKAPAPSSRAIDAQRAVHHPPVRPAAALGRWRYGDPGSSPLRHAVLLLLLLLRHLFCRRFKAGKTVYMGCVSSAEALRNAAASGDVASTRRLVGSGAVVDAKDKARNLLS